MEAFPKKKGRDAHLLVLYLARLNPCLDLISIPLQLLDLLFQIRLEFLFLIRVICIVNLKTPKKRTKFNHRLSKSLKKSDQTERKEFFSESDLVPDAIEDVDAFLNFLQDSIDLALQFPARSHREVDEEKNR